MRGWFTHPCSPCPIAFLDVSGLFPDVLKNMQTEDLEQKKLVYLYLMNYAKTQPELVILAVNTFVKDTDDPNPLVRALAIRTMGCLRAEKIIDYLCDPLQKCLRDENPYVRKTAALCVAKLYDLKPELVLENGFLDQLQEMIADSNPMVRPSVRRVTMVPTRLIGRSQYGYRPFRYPYLCHVPTTFPLAFRSGVLHDHLNYPYQALDRTQRMFGVGKSGYSECSRTI